MGLDVFGQRFELARDLEACGFVRLYRAFRLAARILSEFAISLRPLGRG
jgi:hypothetical protein